MNIFYRSCNTLFTGIYLGNNYCQKLKTPLKVRHTRRELRKVTLYVSAKFEEAYLKFRG